MDSKVKVIKIITVSAVVLIFLLVISFFMNLIKLINATSTEAKLKEQLILIDEQITQNSEQIATLESNEYLDWYAREYLNMKGRDDEAFTIK